MFKWYSSQKDRFYISIYYNKILLLHLILGITISDLYARSKNLKYRVTSFFLHILWSCDINIKILTSSAHFKIIIWLISVWLIYRKTLTNWKYMRVISCKMQGQTFLYSHTHLLFYFLCCFFFLLVLCIVWKGTTKRVNKFFSFPFQNTIKHSWYLLESLTDILNIQLT